MIIAILLFVLGLVLLIKGGDWFVDGSTKIAEIFNIPEILIGKFSIFPKYLSARR